MGPARSGSLSFTDLVAESEIYPKEFSKNSKISYLTFEHIYDLKINFERSWLSEYFLMLKGLQKLFITKKIVFRQQLKLSQYDVQVTGSSRVEAAINAYISIGVYIILLWCDPS